MCVLFYFVCVCVCVVRKIVILKSLCLCIREEVFLKTYCQLCVCVCVLFCCCLTINSYIVSYRFTSNFQISALRRVMIFLLSLLFLTIKPSQSIDNGIGVSPPMGWRSWNQFQCNINQSLIEETYALMTSTSRNDENVRIFIRIHTHISSRNARTTGEADIPLGFRLRIGGYRRLLAKM